MLEDKERIIFIWNEYKDQNDWQRHNESQRAQLSSILLAISAALVALFPNERPFTQNDWLIPAFLIVIGLFGILAIMKYWERFMYHVQLERAYRKILDSYFASNNDELKDEDRLSAEKNLFLKTREAAINTHEKGRLPLLKDRYLMQHWLWGIVFGLIALLGVVLMARVGGFI